jgi:parallel beta-helix repeat protein
LFSHTERKASNVVIVGVGVALAFVMVTLAGTAAAKTIHVRAKQNDAINKAIDRANAGDRLVVHKGTYKGPVVVDKRVRIVGRKKKHGRKSRKPMIAVGCAAFTGVDVTAEGASLRRLKIRGGEEYSLDISSVEQATARQLRLIDQCDALYGINVYESGAIQLLSNRPSGYLDAGIYVGDITDTGTGTLLVEGNDSFGNNRGLIVEFSAGGDLRVLDNHFHDNALPGVGAQSGIFVNDSLGVRFDRNLVEDNGDYGIEFTPGSNSNQLFDNVFRGNPVNVLNPEGNCGSGNSPNPFPACP